MKGRVRQDGPEGRRKKAGLKESKSSPFWISIEPFPRQNSGISERRKQEGALPWTKIFWFLFRVGSVFVLSAHYWKWKSSLGMGNHKLVGLSEGTSQSEKEGTSLNRCQWVPDHWQVIRWREREREWKSSRWATTILELFTTWRRCQTARPSQLLLSWLPIAVHSRIAGPATISFAFRSGYNNRGGALVCNTQSLSLSLSA